MSTRERATIEDLYRIPENGKAEIVNGDIVTMAPTGSLPGWTGGNLFFSLKLYERTVGGGRAIPDNVGFIVNLPNRRSFSPDVAFHKGELKGGRFFEGAPVFAVEVRSENDYGASAEKAMAQKRADYFAAGTLVVWDVDVLQEQLIRVYRADNPLQPEVSKRGETAHAEPALLGWQFEVEEIFR